MLVIDSSSSVIDDDFTRLMNTIASSLQCNWHTNSSLTMIIFAFDQIAPIVWSSDGFIEKIRSQERLLGATFTRDALILANEYFLLRNSTSQKRTILITDGSPSYGEWICDVVESMIDFGVEFWAWLIQVNHESFEFESDCLRSQGASVTEFGDYNSLFESEQILTIGCPSKEITLAPTYIPTAPPTEKPEGHTAEVVIITLISLSSLFLTVILCMIIYYFGTINLKLKNEKNMLRRFEIPFADLVSDWNRKSEVGSGSFGRVFKATYGTDEVAVKFLDSDYVDTNMIFLDKEFRLLEGLRHPNLVTCYGYSNDVPKSACIVFEYIKGQNMFKLIHRARDDEIYIPLHEKYNILAKASWGLVKLHDIGIIHRDRIKVLAY